LRYYDLENHWDKIQPHLKNEAVQKALKDGMDELLSRWDREFDTTKVPRDYEWNNWHWAIPHDKEPEYWKYTLFNACFWLVNFNYELAKAVEPDENWQIVRNDKHATVWNGDDLLFEFNLLAFGWSADKCYELAKN
jgi:hypothetical protein